MIYEVWVGVISNRDQRCHTEVVELWKSRPSDRELLQRQTREDDQGEEVKKRSTKGAKACGRKSLLFGGREETVFLIARRTIYNLSQDEFTEVFW